MSGAFKKVSGAVTGLQNKKGKHAISIFGDGSLTREATRISNQKHAAYLGPIFNTQDMSGTSGESGEAGAALRDPYDVFGETEIRKTRAAEEEAARNYKPPTPIPDEEEIARVQRREAKRRGRRGRSSTVLSDSFDGDGLGG